MAAITALLLLRGGVPRSNSFVTVLGAQPIALEMARTPNPCFFRALMEPRSFGPKCCPLLRSG